MSVQVKHRRDIAANVAAFTGAPGEIIADTTNNRLVLQDGATAGGWPAAKLAEVVTNARRTVADANTSVAAGDRTIAYTALTAPRTVSLCAASAFPAGTTLLIIDETGLCSAANAITISRAGADTISGITSATLNGPYMSALLESNGANAWTLVADGVAQTCQTLGIATAPDPNNPLSVFGSSALFNGASFNFTINKSASANTASLLFQDGFSGRAQVGLNGNDNLSFKVSPNGSTWTTAISIDATTGAPSFANQRTGVSDAAYAALTTDRLIAYTAITAARIVTLPAASTFPSGMRLVVVDESGSASSVNTITLARAGSDTIDGATTAVISAPHGYLEVESNGSSAWTILNQTPMPLTGGAFAGAVTLAAGTSTSAALRFQSGTNLTAAAAGVMEYDGAVFYSSVSAGERGVVPSEQVQTLASAYTLASQTAPQKLFNASAAGAITLGVGTYQFECLFALTAMSSTSGSFGFALGGSAAFSQSWQSKAAQPASLATAAAAQFTYNTSANASLTSASVNTAGHAYIKGILRVTTGGTIIPEVSLTVAAAAVVAANSYFKVSPLGSAGVTNVGNWS